jgi:homoserine dehydrogenase
MSAVLSPEDAVSVPGTTQIPHTTQALRTIRLGILGLGQVGQAVARLAAEATRLEDAGFDFRIAGALVRDIDRPRRCILPSRLATTASAFLGADYDVVIEAMPAIEPARTLVARLLGRGIPVVSANKALIAAHGTELVALAASRGTWFRYEASALAGVPFLGALAARPLVSDIDRFIAIVNGTSNFILSKLEHEGWSFDEALADAQRLGLTEPNPSRDLDGLDAADKMSLLASLFGWGSVPAAAVDVQGIRDITARDFEAAALLDATIKPIVWSTRRGSTLEAFIGPALVPRRHPLAGLSGTLGGIQISGQYVSDLFFSGPGAGPDITAATLLDDAVEAVSSVPRSPRVPVRPSSPLTISSPATEWFIRLRFPGVIPDASAATAILQRHGLEATRVTDAIGDARWLPLKSATRAQIDRAIFVIARTHRINCHAIRATSQRTHVVF